MSPLGVGTSAPPVPGFELGAGPVGLFFYKVTCPTCQLAALAMATFERAFPGRVVGIGQDPPEELERFTAEYHLGIGSIPDLAPYEVSNAYEIVSVPTLFLVGPDGRILESVGAWDRQGFERVALRIAELTGAEPVEIVTPEGVPDFKPG